MSPVLDAHTHRYPDEVIADPVAWAKARGEGHWRELVAPEGRPSLQAWADREQMLADMDAAGVSKAVLLGWYWENPETCHEQNAWHARWMAEDSERFIAFASVHPAEGERALEALRRAQGEGFRGIGEVHLGVQGVAMRDPRWLRIVEFACEAGMPINFHVSEVVGRAHAGRVPTPYEDFQWLAETYPELKIILAHWGGLMPYFEMNPHVKKTFRNVLYDTAAGPLLYDMRIWKTMIDTVGAQKILFGSDYPLRLFPKVQPCADFCRYLEAVRELALDEADTRAILYENAARVLGL